jgi:hypothetical protein
MATEGLPVKLACRVLKAVAVLTRPRRRLAYRLQ